ncbi:hypothetical protein [Tunturiibacter psychrotolerans]|uniref:hypothetical protein n=1 Tax=Tunturiibacter psychrotolerans TaxID=3069686 RepID=UPI003D208DFB
MKPSLLALLLILVPPSFVGAQSKASWRAATPTELQMALPARAPVEKERIETEMRTASGIINSRGNIIAGVVLITAGYSADGKYSHYLLVQSPITFGNLSLTAGNYVIGWHRGDDDLIVNFYDAATGREHGAVTAHHLATGSRVESFRIWPPTINSILQIGRFAIPYTLEKQPTP